MLATDVRQPDAGGAEGRRKVAGGGGGVKTWPWVSLNIPPAQLAEFTRLAAASGRSRADLLREVLEQVGLPYARAIAASRAAPGEPGARRRRGQSGGEEGGGDG